MEVFESWSGCELAKAACSTTGIRRNICTNFRFDNISWGKCLTACADQAAKISCLELITLANVPRIRIIQLHCIVFSRYFKTNPHCISNLSATKHVTLSWCLQAGLYWFKPVLVRTCLPWAICLYWKCIGLPRIVDGWCSCRLTMELALKMDCSGSGHTACKKVQIVIFQIGLAQPKSTRTESH